LNELGSLVLPLWDISISLIENSPSANHSLRKIIGNSLFDILLIFHYGLCPENHL